MVTTGGAIRSENARISSEINVRNINAGSLRVQTQG